MPSRPISFPRPGGLLLFLRLMAGPRGDAIPWLSRSQIRGMFYSLSRTLHAGRTWSAPDIDADGRARPGRRTWRSSGLAEAGDRLRRFFAAGSLDESACDGRKYWQLFFQIRRRSQGL